MLASVTVFVNEILWIFYVNYENGFGVELTAYEGKIVNYVIHVQAHVKVSCLKLSNLTLWIFSRIEYDDVVNITKW